MVVTRTRLVIKFKRIIYKN